MGDLVNLRQVRKNKQRDQKAKKADQNRALHGRTRHERTLTDAERKQAEKRLEGHQRSTDDAETRSADIPPETPKADPKSKDQAKSVEDESNVVVIFSADGPDKS